MDAAENHLKPLKSKPSRGLPLLSVRLKEEYRYQLGRSFLEFINRSEAVMMIANINDPSMKTSFILQNMSPSARHVAIQSFSRHEEDEDAHYHEWLLEAYQHMERLNSLLPSKIATLEEDDLWKAGDQQCSIKSDASAAMDQHAIDLTILDAELTFQPLWKTPPNLLHHPDAVISPLTDSRTREDAVTEIFEDDAAERKDLTATEQCDYARMSPPSSKISLMSNWSTTDAVLGEESWTVVLSYHSYLKIRFATNHVTMNCDVVPEPTTWRWTATPEGEDRYNTHESRYVAPAPQNILQHRRWKLSCAILHFGRGRHTAVTQVSNEIDHFARRIASTNVLATHHEIHHLCHRSPSNESDLDWTLMTLKIFDLHWCRIDAVFRCYSLWCYTCYRFYVGEIRYHDIWMSIPRWPTTEHYRTPPKGCYRFYGFRLRTGLQLAQEQWVFVV